MKVKDPIWIFFYITEDHEDGTKKTAIFVSAESKETKSTPSKMLWLPYMPYLAL